MILCNVRLKNIRSYKEAVIKFEEGTTLLAGDIGAGKSTILHAVEFALFGVLRGVLGGESPLRNGANDGLVALEMEVEGKPVIIQRALRRTKQGVGQEAGSIIIDGISQQLTATELKSRILDILGYPSELLTKNKGLIYRYTVYTPQEDMKSILFEGTEIRLNTLRRVFDIDKYARIEENSKLFSKAIREECRRYEGMIADLELKQALLKSRTTELDELLAQSEAAKRDAAAAKKALLEAAKMQEAVEASLRKLNELRQRLAVAEHEQSALVVQRSRASVELEATKKNLAGLISTQMEAATSTINTIQSSLQAAEQDMRAIDQEIKTAMQSIGTAKCNVSNCMDLSKKLNSMSTCPTCKQTVTEEHKSTIQNQELEKLAVHKKELETRSIAIAQLETRKAETQKHLNELRTAISAASAAQAQEKHKQDLIARTASLAKQVQESERKIAQSSALKTDLSRLIFPLENTEQDMKNAKEAYLSTLAADKNATSTLARLSAQQESLSRQISDIKKEISEKITIKERLARDKKTLLWMDEGFIGMMKLMEQQVMANVHSQFGEAFTKWFNTLIEDNLMTVRLDEDFTPIVTQNGYDTPSEDLSGGEKTSLALAYRLALNKVINDLHTSIKTRDLIILDEPTDGFSSEQLDRVRDVLNDLPVRQRILVSHESKIESFVDRIITIQKEGHISKIASKIA